MTPLGFAPEDDDPRLALVGAADAREASGDSPQTIANVVHVHVERDRGLVLALVLALLALALRR
jgi:hypothetical protein